jgi:hypothetical protein
MTVIKMSYFKDITEFCKYSILKVTNGGSEQVMWLGVNKTKIISHL